MKTKPKKKQTPSIQNRLNSTLPKRPSKKRIEEISDFPMSHAEKELLSEIIGLQEDMEADRGGFSKLLKDLGAQVDFLQKELDESARLHGMGSSREAKLLADKALLSKKVTQLVGALNLALPYLEVLEKGTKHNSLEKKCIHCLLSKEVDQIRYAIQEES